MRHKYLPQGQRENHAFLKKAVKISEKQQKLKNNKKIRKNTKNSQFKKCKK
mgnify:CR=1 FL=1